MNGLNSKGAEWPQQMREPDTEDLQEFRAGTGTLQNQTQIVYQTNCLGFTALVQTASPDGDATLQVDKAEGIMFVQVLKGKAILQW